LLLGYRGRRAEQLTGAAHAVSLGPISASIE
jgi:hypothetical protein